MNALKKAWGWLRPILPSASLGALLQTVFEKLFSVLF